MTGQHTGVAVIGGGILGLAHAYAAAKRGLRVTVFERQERAQGASLRNFGLIWPIGQPPGALLALALRSREIWLELLASASIPYLATGSLHAAYRADEEAVTREFAALAPAHGYDCRWLPPAEALIRSPAVVAQGLRGALASATELTVDPRIVLDRLPQFLAARYGVSFEFGCAVHAASPSSIETGRGRWRADRVIVCAGDDFETLFPALFASAGMTRCKLQMMRTPPQPNGWQLGPALAGGLTLRYYPSFELCPSLPALKRRVAEETPEYDRWGIHVMLSQTPAGEITIGDSHEYARSVDIFDKPSIDELILGYLGGFARLPDLTIAQRWHGVYARQEALPYFIASPEPGVEAVTVTRGIGMTLSFGLAEQVIGRIEGA